MKSFLELLFMILLLAVSAKNCQESQKLLDRVQQMEGKVRVYDLGKLDSGFNKNGLIYSVRPYHVQPSYSLWTRKDSLKCDTLIIK